MAVSECICVRCPQGCVIEVGLPDSLDTAGELTVGADGRLDYAGLSIADLKEIATVRGNACARGVDYAIAEVTRPERVLAMTIPVVGCLEPLSVKTSAPVPKDMMCQVVGAIRELRLVAPVRIHQVVLRQVCGLDVDVVATKTVG